MAIDIEKEMKNFGFGIEASKHDYDLFSNTPYSEYHFKKNDEDPEIDVRMTEYPLRASFIVTSSDFDEDFTFSSKGFVDKKIALNLMSTYLQSTQHMRKSKGIFSV